MEHWDLLLDHAVGLHDETRSRRVFVFLCSEKIFRWFLRSAHAGHEAIVLVLPKTLGLKEADLARTGLKPIMSWAGSQSRFSRIKYAFLYGVLKGYIDTSSRVVCLLGPWGRDHLDTVTVHDLAHSWSEEFPFDPLAIISKNSFRTVMAVVDVALDIGAMGREGKPVGTTFVVGDSKKVLASSHQAVFNPFKGYAARERNISTGEVVESVKELAKLDGAFVITSQGVVEASGRHLETPSIVAKKLRGLGSRHRAAAGITRKTGAVAVVVSESTGRVTVFSEGRIIASLEPLISRRLV